MYLPFANPDKTFSYKETFIVFEGRVPSKKNQKRIGRTKDGTPFILSSKKHEEWVAKEVSTLIGQIETLIPPYIFVVEMYAPDAANADLSNKWETIGDVLIDAEVIEDDNWFKLCDLHLRFRGIDRENPRIEVTIHSQTEVQYHGPDWKDGWRIHPKSKREGRKSNRKASRKSDRGNGDGGNASRASHNHSTGTRRSRVGEIGTLDSTQVKHPAQ